MPACGHACQLPVCILSACRKQCPLISVLLWTGLNPLALSCMLDGVGEMRHSLWAFTKALLPSRITHCLFRGVAGNNRLLDLKQACMPTATSRAGIKGPTVPAAQRTRAWQIGDAHTCMHHTAASPPQEDLRVSTIQSRLVMQAASPG